MRSGLFAGHLDAAGAASWIHCAEPEMVFARALDYALETSLQGIVCDGRHGCIRHASGCIGEVYQAVYLAQSEQLTDGDAPKKSSLNALTRQFVSALNACLFEPRLSAQMSLRSTKMVKT